MATIFTPSIHYNGHSASYGPCQATLAEAMRVAFADATYYLGHHDRVTVRIEEACPHCNMGLVTKARGRGKKKCPECRGNHTPNVWQFESVPHVCVRSIDNGTGDAVQRAG